MEHVPRCYPQIVAAMASPTRLSRDDRSVRDPLVKKWVAGARPRTLPAAIVPVLVGTACAVGETKLIWWRAAAAMIAAVAIQVGTNYANDHSDGKRGTDDPGRRAGPVRLVGS